MNTATLLHRTAMEFYDLAGIYQAKGKPTFFDDYRQRAWLLEKEAAMQMLSEIEDYTFKYVVIHSAASLGFDLKYFEEAKHLLELGLMGNPEPFEKQKMEELLAKISKGIKPKAAIPQSNELTVSGTLTLADIEKKEIKIREKGKQKLRAISVSAEMIKQVIRFYLGELVDVQLDKNEAGGFALKHISKAA